MIDKLRHIKVKPLLWSWAIMMKLNREQKYFRHNN